MRKGVTSADADAGSGRQSDQAFDEIKREIILCRLVPGARFSEVELAARMGLARAATRAALMRLEQVQLVQPVPRHGFVVTPITVLSIREAFELRLMVEPQAVALATGKVDVARLRAINSAPQKAKGERAQLAFVENNRAFHREIAAAASNGRLFQLLESLADEMERLVHMGLFGPTGTDVERQNADHQHEALIAAFAAGDPQAAEREARIHIEHARSLAMNALLNSPWPVPLK
jgi:DNA-binding GntR family transcriptional regulator